MTHRARTVCRVLLGVAALSIAATGVANAIWSSAASGSGPAGSSAMTISGEALTGQTANSALYPGGTAEVVLKLHNPNGYAVQVVAITATGTPAADNGCTPTGVSFTSPASFADPQFSLAANQSTVLRLPGAMAMDTTSASTCQGRTFSLLVTVTVRK